MTDEQLASFFPACNAIAWTFCQRNSLYLPHIEDAKQEGKIACWLSSLKHDPEKGTFWTFAHRRVRGAVIDYLRKTRIIPRFKPSVVVVPLDKVVLFEVASVAFADPANRIDARRMLDSIPSERNRAITERHYLEEETMLEIALDLGLTESRVSQILSAARLTMKLAL